MDDLSEGRRAMRAVAELERRSRARETAPERTAAQAALDEFHAPANQAPEGYGPDGRVVRHMDKRQAPRGGE